MLSSGLKKPDESSLSIEFKIPNEYGPSSSFDIVTGLGFWFKDILIEPNSLTDLHTRIKRKRGKHTNIGRG